MKCLSFIGLIFVASGLLDFCESLPNEKASVSNQIMNQLHKRKSNGNSKMDNDMKGTKETFPDTVNRVDTSQLFDLHIFF